MSNGAALLTASLSFLIKLSLICQSSDEVSWSSGNVAHISVTFHFTLYIVSIYIDRYIHADTLNMLSLRTAAIFILL